MMCSTAVEDHGGTANGHARGTGGMNGSVVRVDVAVDTRRCAGSMLLVQEGRAGREKARKQGRDGRDGRQHGGGGAGAGGGAGMVLWDLESSHLLRSQVGQAS